MVQDRPERRNPATGSAPADSQSSDPCLRCTVLADSPPAGRPILRRPLKPTAGRHRMRQNFKPTAWARRSAMKPQRTIAGIGLARGRCGQRGPPPNARQEPIAASSSFALCPRYRPDPPRPKARDPTRFPGPAPRRGQRCRLLVGFTNRRPSGHQEALAERNRSSSPPPCPLNALDFHNSRWFLGHGNGIAVP